MLSSLEMVSVPSGKTKTLVDLIKDMSIITPETPVYTSNDMLVLESYIKALVADYIKEVNDVTGINADIQ